MNGFLGWPIFGAGIENTKGSAAEPQGPTLASQLRKDRCHADFLVRKGTAS